MLRRAGFLDEAHAAMHLHAERGDLDADIGGEGLGDRRQQRGARIGELARGVGLAPDRAVELHAGGVAEGARRAGHRPHGQEHALDVRVVDDRLAHLLAVARVAHGLLQRAFGDRHALQADGEPRAVHHREHAQHALVFFADQPAGGAAFVAIDHGAGRRGMDAHLVLDRMGAHVVARAVFEKLRHEKKRDALGAGRCIGQAGQHEVNDIVGEIVLAIGDEDFRAGDFIGAVGGTFGLGAQRADIGAGLRLGQLHRAHPHAADQLFEIFLLQLSRAIGMQGVDRGHGQHRADAEGHRGRVPHFDAGGVDRVRQFLTAEIGRRGKAVPAGRGPGGVGLLPARRHGDLAVLERRSKRVAGAVERGDDVGGEFAGFLEDRIDRLLVEVAIDAVGDRGAHSGGVFEGKGDVGNRGAVCHGCNLAGLAGRSKAPAGRGRQALEIRGINRLLRR